MRLYDNTAAHNIIIHENARLRNIMARNIATPNELAAWLCSLYDITSDVILQDVERQLAEWKRFGLID